MSLVYLLGGLIVIMLVVLMTLFIKPLRRFAGYVALLAPILASGYFLAQIPNVLHGKFVEFKIPWMPAIDVNLDFRLDGLGLMFGLIISIIGWQYSSMLLNIYLLIEITYRVSSYIYCYSCLVC